MKMIVTGGAGFIGSNFVQHMVNKYPDYEIINLDLLTYAGNLENLKPVEDKPNYRFIKGDIADRAFIFKLFEEEKPDVVVNFAAESHVDRSITDPEAFVRTNVMGTTTLLDACRTYGPSHLQPLFLLQGQRGPVCPGLPQDLRAAGDGIPLLQQLRPLPFPGEADSPYDQPCPGG